MVPELVGLAVMDALPRDPIEPELLQFAHRVHIAPLPTERVLRTAGAPERAAYNERTMKRCDASVQVWTDGSSKTDEEFPLGTGACGAIAFIDGRPGDVLLHNVGTPACSYTAEEAGVLLGVRLAAASTAATVGIFSDGQSVQSLLALGPVRQRTTVGVDIWRALLRAAQHKSSISLTFVFAHCKTAEGDAVDLVAGEAHGEPCQPLAISYREVRRVRLRLLKEEHDVDAATRMNFRAEVVKKPTLLPRLRGGLDQRRLASLRCGVCHLLSDLAHDAPPQDCTACGEVGCLFRGGGKAVLHLLKCPAVRSFRESVGLRGIVDELWTMPTQVLALLEVFRRTRA